MYEMYESCSRIRVREGSPKKKRMIQIKIKKLKTYSKNRSRKRDAKSKETTFEKLSKKEVKRNKISLKNDAKTNGRFQTLTGESPGPPLSPTNLRRRHPEETQDLLKEDYLHRQTTESLIMKSLRQLAR